MDIKTYKGRLEITDKEGMSVRLEPKDVADLIGYLKVNMRSVL